MLWGINKEQGLLKAIQDRLDKFDNNIPKWTIDWWKAMTTINRMQISHDLEKHDRFNYIQPTTDFLIMAQALSIEMYAPNAIVFEIVEARDKLVYPLLPDQGSHKELHRYAYKCNAYPQDEFLKRASLTTRDYHTFYYMSFVDNGGVYCLGVFIDKKTYKEVK
jgi:hypothetical protein